MQKGQVGATQSTGVLGGASMEMCKGTKAMVCGLQLLLGCGRPGLKVSHSSSKRRSETPASQLPAMWGMAKSPQVVESSRGSFQSAKAVQKAPPAPAQKGERLHVTVKPEIPGISGRIIRARQAPRFSGGEYTQQSMGKGVHAPGYLPPPQVGGNGLWAKGAVKGET